MNLSNNERAYRCSVVPDNSAAKLKLGRRYFRVNVLDTSREGFCVRVPDSVARKLNYKSRPVLMFGGEKWEVQLKSRYSDTPQFTNVGLSRVRELTKIKVPISWGWFFPARTNSPSDPTLLAFLMAALVIAVLCLPGLGDQIGTAPEFRKTVKAIIKTPR